MLVLRQARQVVVFTLASGLVACSDSSPPRAPNACVPDAAGQAWTLQDATSVGPYAVGTHDETFVDDTRATPAYGTYAGADTRTLPITVWYPTTAAGADVPIATDGPFPVVLYSHGFSSFRGENSRLAKHLASHGYVVVAPTFPLSNLSAPAGPTTIDIAGQPRDLSFVLDRIVELSTTSGSVLQDGVDAERIAAAGLSMGGLTTLLVTFHPELRDSRIDVAIAMAPLASILLPSFYATTDTPLTVLFGDADGILAYDPNATSVRDRADAPFDLLTLAHGTHTGFTAISALFEGSYDNVDTAGCDGFMAVGGPNPSEVDFESLLGGAAMGIENPTPWVLCPADLGIGMSPTRQLTLEDAAVRARLDAYLSPDAVTRGRACHFVEDVLPREDDLDIARR